MDASAYYAAYKQKDPYDGCRTNAVLLIYDGHEDARYTRNPDGSITYADPSKAAAALLQENVKTYVVIISSDKGDIAQANAIAQAGGTKAAYQVNNASDLTNALTSVFNVLQGSVVTAAPAVPGFVQNGSLAYTLASNNASGSMQGFLYAFSTDASGNVSSSPVWSLQMTQNQRQTALLTDTGSGTAPIQFQNAPTSLFRSSPPDPDPQTIINYTINPSYNSGNYLAGRQSGSFLGTITSKAERPILLKTPNNPYFLSNTGYQSFGKSNAGRQPLVLFTANDGFLYAISSGSTSSPGTLQWAWMPSPLVAQLKNYRTFESTSPMNGGMQTVDSTDADGKWATYVVGTAQSGALHYDLKLSNCTSGSSCTPSIQNVWLDQQSGAASPPAAAPQAPQIWWDANGVAYAYYFTTVGGTSYLNVMRLYDGSTSRSAVSFTPTSTVSVDVQGGKLYVGGQDGSIWMFDLTAGPKASQVAGNPVSIGRVPNEPAAGPVRYVGFAQTSAGVYVWATTDYQVSVFKFTGGAVTNAPIGVTQNGWTLWWWSSSTGSGKTSVSSSGKASTTTTSSNPGVTSTSDPYWLQSGATISDASVVEANALIVPVTVGQSSNACAATTAVYDLFNLDTGVFPQNTFFDANHNVLVTDPTVGLGTAYTPVVSQNGAGQLIVYGSASQNQQGKIGFQVAATSGIHVGPGLMGWQPVWMTMP
jgi:type IV pilus assembly protein PilY1